MNSTPAKSTLYGGLGLATLPLATLFLLISQAQTAARAAAQPGDLAAVFGWTLLYLAVGGICGLGAFLMLLRPARQSWLARCGAGLAAMEVLSIIACGAYLLLQT